LFPNAGSGVIQSFEQVIYIQIPTYLFRKYGIWMDVAAPMVVCAFIGYVHNILSFMGIISNIQSAFSLYLDRWQKNVWKKAIQWAFWRINL